MEKNKNYILKTLMGSPSTSKILMEAWGSPVGSTSRAKARAILKSLNNTSPTVDGRGGPATSFMSIPGQPNPNFSSIIGSPSDTAVKNYAPFNVPTTTIPQIPPVNKLPPAEKTEFNQFSLNAPILRLASNVAAVVPAAAYSLSRAVDTAGTISDNIQKFLLNKLTQAVVSPESYKPRQLTPVSEVPESGASQFLKTLGTNILYPNKGIAPSTLAKTQTTQEGLQQQDVPSQPKTQQDYSTTADTTVPGTIEDQNTNVWNDLLTYTQNAISSGQPLQSVISDVMSSPATLSQLFPNIPEDQLQMLASGTESGAIANLQKNINDMLGLDDLAKKKINLASTGDTLVKDLSDYVGTRDQYTKDVDKTINEIKSKMLSGGASTDPITQQLRSTYLNELYTLKAGQNQRYIDLINKAVDKYNTDVKSLDSQITDATNKYDSLLSTNVPIIQEQYNTIFNEVANYLTSASSVLSNGTNPFGSLTISANSSAAKDALEGSKVNLTSDFSQMDKFLKPDGKTISTTGLGTKINELLHSGTQIQPQSIFMYLQSAIDQAAANASSDPETSINQLASLKNAMLDLKKNNVDSILGIPGAGQTLFNGVVELTKSPVSEYIKSNYEVVKAAIKALIDKVKNPDDIEQVNKWKSDIGATLNYTFMNALLDYYKNAVSHDAKAAQNKRYAFDLNGRDPNDMTMDELVNNVAGGIAAMWGAETQMIQ